MVSGQLGVGYMFTGGHMKTKLFVVLSACLILIATLVVQNQERLAKSHVQMAGVPKGTRQPVVEAYGNLSLSFEANQGQTDGSVKFLSRGNGYTLFLTVNEAVLALRKSEPRAAGPSGHGFSHAAEKCFPGGALAPEGSGGLLFNLPFASPG